MVHWGTAMFAMSLTTNIVVTAAVAGRIWVSHSSASTNLLYVTHGVPACRYVTIYPRSNIPRQSSVHYTRLILLIIESGSIITAAKLIEFVLFLVSMPYTSSMKRCLKSR